ncbi:hypothetical protein EII18_02935 [Comamonadaceae bacterium OH3737_COT-264]|nr:hypothetical protein EII18_02935 [Comamonadaceae bacterium OH3737_COT-264]
MIELFSSPQPHAQTTGHWQTLRLCLDRAAQEWLNVGVLLRTHGGQTHMKLLESVDGLRCLYDEDAANNALFLLEQAESALAEGQDIPKGWNIELGPPKFIRGAKEQTILDSLFDRLVTLGRHQIDSADRLDRENHRHATRNVRTQVRRIINRQLQLARNATPDFWRTQPQEVPVANTTVLLDLQICSTKGKQRVNGTVASAWYKTHYHRSASLSSAVAATVGACNAFPDGDNLLYLLLPPADAPGLSTEDLQAIEREVHSCQWLLNEHGAKLRVTNSEQAIAQNILQDLTLLPEVV